MLSALRYSLRSLARRPGTTALLVTSIALGIGATTAIFTVLDATMLRGAPFRDNERIVEVWSYDAKSKFSTQQLTAAAVEHIRGARGLFEQTATYREAEVLVTGAGEPRALRVVRATSELLPLLGVSPKLGRGLTADDVRPESPDVVVLSERLWRDMFGGRPDVVGARVAINEKPHTIIGVLPSRLRYPSGEVFAWLPLKPATSPAGPAPRVRFVARLRGSMTIAAAEREITNVGTQIVAAGASAEGVRLMSVASRLNADVKRGLLVLAAAALCVLLIACTNAANILLLRASERAREIVIRTALGASRGRILRLFLGESALVALLGGALGVTFAYWGVDALVAAIPPDMSVFSYNAIAIDGRVLAFSLILSLATGVGFGIGPALRATSVGARLALSERLSTASRWERAFRGMLVIAEVSFCMLLLAGAGLFMASFMRLTATDPGYRASGLLTLGLTPVRSRYPTAEARATLYAAVEQRLRGLPGVRAVSMSSALPPQAGSTFPSGLEAEGVAPLAPNTVQVMPMLVIDSAFFSVTRIPLVVGRPFTALDTKGNDEVAIIDRDLASLLWPNLATVVGRRFRMDADGPWLTVVGVAAPANLVGLTTHYGRYALYRPMGQVPSWTTSLAIALDVAGDASALAPLVRQAIHAVDKLQPVSDIATIERRLADTLAQPRFLFTLMSVFAIVALVLAIVGVYGVLSSMVTQRTREIGIRIALGAESGDIARGVVGRGLGLSAAGVMLGIAAVVGLRKVVASALYGFSPTDPLTIGIVAAILLATALAATLAPARRASRVDPRTAMSAE